MAIELKVPSVGESITEVQIGKWLKGEGQRVAQDEDLVEIETDKATVAISAPVAGTISKVLKHEGDAAQVGDVIGYLEPAAVATESAAGQPAGPAVAAPPAGTAADAGDEAAAAAARAQAAKMIQTPKAKPERPAPRPVAAAKTADETSADRSTHTAHADGARPVPSASGQEVARARAASPAVPCAIRPARRAPVEAGHA